MKAKSPPSPARSKHARPLVITALAPLTFGRVDGSGYWTIWNVSRGCGSLRLDVGRPDHLAPLLGLVGDEPSKVGGRARKYAAAEIGKPRLHLGISERSVDPPVELSTISVGVFLGAPTPY